MAQPMKRLLGMLATAISIAVLSGCSDDNELIPNGDAAENLVEEVPSPGEVVDGLREEIEDRLDCSGYIREETRNLITDVVIDGDVSELDWEAGEIARLVGAAAVTTNTTALLVGNLVSMMQVGHLGRITEGDWDSLTCDSTATFDCEDALTGERKGTGSTTVQCEQNSPAKIALNFAGGCTPVSYTHLTLPTICSV